MLKLRIKSGAAVWIGGAKLLIGVGKKKGYTDIGIVAPDAVSIVRDSILTEDERTARNETLDTNREGRRNR
jgi:sRNA-binding carbon storage regulator CsrA